MTPAIVSVAWQWLGHVLFAAGLTIACRYAPWRWLGRGTNLNRLAAATVAILVIWQLRGELGDGPTFHLLGATALTLAFGWQLAVLGLAVVLTVSTFASGAGWGGLGINGTVSVLIAVATSYAIARVVERKFPPHLFVYIFGSGFFGAALTVGVVTLVTAGILESSGQLPDGQVAELYLPMSVLLLFPEAFLTGGVVTLTAVYRPEWLVSFDRRAIVGEH